MRVRLDEGVLHRLVRLGRVAQVVIRDAAGAALVPRRPARRSARAPRPCSPSACMRLDGRGRGGVRFAGGDEGRLTLLTWNTPRGRAAFTARGTGRAGCPSHYRTGGKIHGWNRFRPSQGSPQGRPKASEFVFARLRYDSGDWDYNPKVAANVLNSLVEYTTIPVVPGRGRDHRPTRRTCCRFRSSS